MTYKEAIEILRSHNEWRRGAEIPMTDPTTHGEAIDCVVEHFRDVTKMVGGIEERAERFCQDNGLPSGACASQVSYGHKCMYDGYLAGATGQKAIDDAEFECKAESYETGFAQGQEVGEREMIDKACEWLAIKGIWSGNTCGELKEYIEDFRKAMED